MGRQVKLLIGYDGSESGDAAIEDIQGAGLSGNVETVVLTVADVWYYPADEEAKVAASSPLDREILRRGEEMRLRSENAVKEAETLASRAMARLRDLFPSWVIHAETTINSPAWGLITKAEEWGADLVVVGSGERSLMERIRFGSTSRKVAGACACSVRVGRRSATDDSIRVLIGMDGSPDAELAVDAVSQRLWPSGSEARLITVLDKRLALAAPSNLPRRVRWSRAGDCYQDQVWVHRMMEAVGAKLQSAGLTISTAIFDGGSASSPRGRGQGMESELNFCGRARP